jgi:hypothetical protein
MKYQLVIKQMVLSKEIILQKKLIMLLAGIVLLKHVNKEIKMERMIKVTSYRNLSIKVCVMGMLTNYLDCSRLLQIVISLGFQIQTFQYHIFFLTQILFLAYDLPSRKPLLKGDSQDSSTSVKSQLYEPQTQSIERHDRIDGNVIGTDAKSQLVSADDYEDADLIAVDVNSGMYSLNDSQGHEFQMILKSV